MTTGFNDYIEKYFEIYRPMIVNNDSKTIYDTIRQIYKEYPMKNIDEILDNPLLKEWKYIPISYKMECYMNILLFLYLDIPDNAISNPIRYIKVYSKFCKEMTGWEHNDNENVHDIIDPKDRRNIAEAIYPILMALCEIYDIEDLDRIMNNIISSIDLQTLSELEECVHIVTYLKSDVSDNIILNLNKYILRGEFVSNHDIYYHVPKKYRNILRLYHPRIWNDMFKELSMDGDHQHYVDHISIYSSSMIVLQRYGRLRNAGSIVNYIGSIECYDYGVSIHKGVSENEKLKSSYIKNITFIPNLEVFKLLVADEVKIVFHGDLLRNLLLYEEFTTVLYLNDKYSLKLAGDANIECMIAYDNPEILRVAKSIGYKINATLALYRAMKIKASNLINYIDTEWPDLNANMEELVKIIPMKDMDKSAFSYVYDKSVKRLVRGDISESRARNAKLKFAEDIFCKAVLEDAKTDIIDYASDKFIELLSDGDDQCILHHIRNIFCNYILIDIDISIVRYMERKFSNILYERKSSIPKDLKDNLTCNQIIAHIKYREKVSFDVLYTLADLYRSEVLRYARDFSFSECKKHHSYLKDSKWNRVVKNRALIAIMRNMLKDDNIDIKILVKLLNVSFEYNRIIMFRSPDRNLMEMMLDINEDYVVSYTDICFSVECGDLKSLEALLHKYDGGFHIDIFDSAAKHDDILEYFLTNQKYIDILNDMMDGPDWHIEPNFITNIEDRDESDPIRDLIEGFIYDRESALTSSNSNPNTPDGAAKS